jgi:hypothetical protein
VVSKTGFCRGSAALPRRGTDTRDGSCRTGTRSSENRPPGDEEHGAARGVVASAHLPRAEGDDSRRKVRDPTRSRRRAAQAVFRSGQGSILGEIGGVREIRRRRSAGACGAAEGRIRDREGRADPGRSGGNHLPRTFTSGDRLGRRVALEHPTRQAVIVYRLKDGVRSDPEAGRSSPGELTVGRQVSRMGRSTAFAAVNWVAWNVGAGSTVSVAVPSACAHEPVGHRLRAGEGAGRLEHGRRGVLESFRGTSRVRQRSGQMTLSVLV